MRDFSFYSITGKPFVGSAGKGKKAKAFLDLNESVIEVNFKIVSFERNDLWFIATQFRSLFSTVIQFVGTLF